MKRILFIFAILASIGIMSVNAQPHDLMKDPGDDGGGSNYPTTYTVTEYKSKTVSDGVLMAVVHYKLTITKRKSDDTVISVVPSFRYGTFTLLDNTYTVIWEADFQASGNEVSFAFEATKPDKLFPGLLFLSSISGPVIMD